MTIMNAKNESRLPKSALQLIAVLAFGAAVMFAQTQAGAPPTAQGPNLKPKPAPGTPLPVPLSPSEVDAKTVEAFDAAVSALKPVPNDIDLTVEVVGLDIKPGSREEKQLNEVAAAGAGKYYGVQDASKLAQVFAKVASGQPAAGGGGGGLVLPKAGGPGLAIAAGVLGFLCLLLLGATIILRRRRAAGPSGPKIWARLDIVYPNGRRAAFEIRTPVTAIGRAGDNALILDDELISGHHAQILAGTDGFRIRDLGSTNGTFVRGERIAEMAIYAGDEFILGSTRLTLGA
jgi:hypothetical protein